MAAPGFTTKIAAALIKARGRGLTHEKCAKEAGISQTALFLWLRRGDEPYATFAKAYRNAEADHKRSKIAEFARQMQSAT